MLDLVIKGGTVVTPSGVGHCDVGVQGERIVALGLPGKLREEAEKTIDASGKIVIPGGIEAHTHVGFPHLVSLWGEVTSGPEELSKAALWGGTTTMLDFANVTIADTADLVAAVHEHLSHFSGRMYVDYSVHASFLGSSTTPGKIAQIRDLVAAGFPSVKVYTTNHAPRPNRPLTRINTGQLVAIMEQAAEHGAVVAVHAEEDEIVQWNYEEAKRNQQWDWHYLPRIRSNLSEELAVRQCIRIAEFTGAAMYVVHTSAKEGVDAIAESRSRGYPIDGETILLYCCFNSQKYEEKDGMKYHTYPSTKSEKDRLQLWDGLFRGNLNILATDAIGTSYKDKTARKTVVDVQGGNNGIEIRMGVAYTEAVVKQGMSLERYVQITSTHPAKLLGFYPRKGAIAPGSDADITILDPTIKKRLVMRDLHLNDYSPWEAWEVEGWPTTVVLRGKVMVDNGAFMGKPTDGKLVFRKIDSSVLTGPIRQG